MCQGLAVRSLRSFSKVCNVWSTEATTQLVRDMEKAHITETHSVLSRLSHSVCLLHNYSDNATKLLINIYSVSSITLLQLKNVFYQSNLLLTYYGHSKTDVHCELLNSRYHVGGL